MIFRIIPVILIGYTLFSCTARDLGGKSGEISQPSQPTTSQACSGTMYNGTCYAGGDSDGDGASDTIEKVKGSDPLKIDSDADGANDFCEILKNTNPQDSTSKPEDCDFNKTPEKTDLDPMIKATCSLYQSQKKEAEWFRENLKTEKRCITKEETDRDGKKVNRTECNYVRIDNDKIKSNEAENFGVIEEAERVTMTIIVEWGVSYRDVLSISNGIMTIKPWFTYFSQYVEDFNDDDRQFDHHLGDLPSTSSYCDAQIQRQANVTVKIGNGETKYTWQHPAFLSFKIPEYENPYPFSIDGISFTDDEGDSIEYLGSPLNNFSYKTHLFKIQVKNEPAGMDDNENYLNCDVESKNAVVKDNVNGDHSDNKNGRCKQQNGLCETRSITISYTYYKTKDSNDELELDYNDIENICKDI